MQPCQDAQTVKQWQKSLSRALEIANKAVKLDTDNQSLAAIKAYTKSMTLLQDVMDGVRSGGGRGRDSEEELSRLQSIYDTYKDRSDILRAIANIDGAE